MWRSIGIRCWSWRLCRVSWRRWSRGGRRSRGGWRGGRRSRESFTTSVRWSTTCRSSSRSTSRTSHWWAYNRTEPHYRKAPYIQTPIAITPTLVRPTTNPAWFRSRTNVSPAAGTQPPCSHHSRWPAWPTTHRTSWSMARSTAGRMCWSLRLICCRLLRGICRGMATVVIIILRKWEGQMLIRM